jgi:hypothetical protein
MKTNLLKRFVIVSVVLLVGSAEARAATLLRNKFTPGEVRHFVLNTTHEMKIKVQGQDITQNMEQTIEMSSKVDAVDDKGNASISLLMDHVKMSISGAGADFHYDTASKEKPKGVAKMLALIFDPLTKKPITMKESPQGKISDVKMPEGMSESIKKAGTAASQMGGEIPSEEDIASEIREGGMVFPDGPISEGKTWTTENTRHIEGLGNQKVKTIYRYVGKETKDGKELDKIFMTASFKTPIKTKTAEVKSMSTEGTVYFDNSAGVAVENNVNTKMNMERDANGAKLNIDMNIVNTVKLVPGDSKTETGK